MTVLEESKESVTSAEELGSPVLQRILRQKQSNFSLARDVGETVVRR